MRGLNQRKVMVTGGTGLIGSAVVYRMLDELAQVICTSRRRAKVESWVDQVAHERSHQLHPIELQLDNPTSITSAFDQLESTIGIPDVLIANASLRDGLGTHFDDLTHDDWNKLFNVDVAGHFLCARELVHRTPKHQPLSIVLLSSIYAVNGTDFRIYPEGMLGTPPQYASVKAALLGLTRDLAARWGNRDVRVNAVIAGGVRSEQRQADEFLKNYNRRVILERMAKPEEIASAVAFLASDDASYITGELLHVDGGLSAW